MGEHGDPKMTHVLVTHHYVRMCIEVLNIGGVSVLYAFEQ